MYNMESMSAGADSVRQVSPAVWKGDWHKVHYLIRGLIVLLTQNNSFLSASGTHWGIKPWGLQRKMKNKVNDTEKKIKLFHLSYSNFFGFLGCPYKWEKKMLQIKQEKIIHVISSDLWQNYFTKLQVYEII